MKDFIESITTAAPDESEALAKDLAKTFASLDKLVSDYFSRLYTPTEFGDKTDELEEALKAQWSDRLDETIVSQMLERFYEVRREGEAQELIKKLKKFAGVEEEPAEGQKPHLEGAA